MILNYIDKGEGKPIVFLHGLAASLNYWNSYVAELSKTNRVIVVDLLGFGRSPQSASDYTPETHVQAIRQTLESLNVHEPLTLVGHSMGALIALKFAAGFPNEISRLVLAGMPIFKSEEEAKKDITKSKKRFKYAYYGLSSRVLCTTWCYALRPISKRLAPLYLPKLPKAVAEDSVLHTWRSYSESLHNVIEAQNVSEDLHKLKIPTVLIYGNKDSQVVLRNAKLPKVIPEHVDVVILEGTHNLPLEKQKEVLGFIR
ncbi:alpha/beta hydrolase [Candidatus Saccharibacteria bacterium]|nr:alpha/beta hydrolase [Candidatus Saccharibacteria bacterium]